MDVPLQITFRGLDHSDAVEDSIREHTQRLEGYFDHVVSCRVVVEAEHHSHQQGNLFGVNIELKVPGKTLVASKNQHDRQEHEDVYVALRDAFEAVRRQLEDYARRQRDDARRQ